MRDSRGQNRGLLGEVPIPGKTIFKLQASSIEKGNMVSPIDLYFGQKWAFYKRKIEIVLIFFVGRSLIVFVFWAILR